MKKIILNNYDKVVKYSIIGNNWKNDLSLHNYYRLKTINKSKSTYYGYLQLSINS